MPFSHQGQGTTAAKNPARILAAMTVVVFSVVILLPLWKLKYAVEPGAAGNTTRSAEVPSTTGNTDAGQRYFIAGAPLSAGYRNPLQVLTNIGYVVAYDNVRKNPAWVAYRVFRTDAMKPPPRPKAFSVDKRTAAGVVSSDYTGSGYDRGHCAPNRAIGICYGEQAQLETFLMSNIIPQKPKLNQQIWEQIEETEIMDFARRFGDVWILTGPVFSSSSLRLKRGVEIPDACFKILARTDRDGSLQVLAFVIPQTVTGGERPETFLRNVDDIERDTGFDVFSELPDNVENRIESQSATRMW